MRARPPRAPLPALASPSARTPLPAPASPARPPGAMQAAPTSRRFSSRSRARALEIAASTPKNTATICLDGTNIDVLHSYIAAMMDLDEWLRDGTEVIDASGFFGPGHDIVRTREGVFHMVFEYEERVKKFRKLEQSKHGLNFGEDTKFIHDERCTVLDIGVNYHSILDDDLERTLTGTWRMRKAISELCKYKGGSAKSIGPYVGTIAVHISEASRSAVVHSFICRSIVDPNLSRLNKGTGLVVWIRKHRALSSQILYNIDRMYKGKEPYPIKHFGLNLTLQDLVLGLRVCNVDSYTNGVFRIEPASSGPRGRRGGAQETGRRPGPFPQMIQRAQFATTCSRMIQMMTTVTEGVFPTNSAENRSGPRETGGLRDGEQEAVGTQSLMLPKSQNGLLTSQVTPRIKAETPRTVKLFPMNSAENRRVPRETGGAQSLMSHRSQNGLLTSQVIKRTKAESPRIVKLKPNVMFRGDWILPKILSCRKPFRILQVGPPVTMGVIVYNSMKELLPPRKGGAAVVDPNCSCNATSPNFFRFFSRRGNNWTFNKP